MHVRRFFAKHRSLFILDADHLNNRHIPSLLRTFVKSLTLLHNSTGLIGPYMLAYIAYAMKNF